MSRQSQSLTRRDLIEVFCGLILLLAASAAMYGVAWLFWACAWIAEPTSPKTNTERPVQAVRR